MRACGWDTLRKRPLRTPTLIFPWVGRAPARMMVIPRRAVACRPLPFPAFTPAGCTSGCATVPFASSTQTSTGPPSTRTPSEFSTGSASGTTDLPSPTSKALRVLTENAGPADLRGGEFSDNPRNLLWSCDEARIMLHHAAGQVCPPVGLGWPLLLLIVAGCGDSQSYLEKE